MVVVMKMIIRKLVSFLLSIVMFVLPWLNIPRLTIDKSSWTTDYAYIFVHGLNGWGEEALLDHVVCYYGSLTGSLMRNLRARGLDCHAASVDPVTSAWDRACELYAQLAGTVTDYGEAHSLRCGHERFGKDYSGKPLIDAFDEENKVNLIGHSFGGATVLMFLELMANGDAVERETSSGDLSPLFAGGKADWVYSLTTLASPTNGTTVYEMINPNTVSTDGYDCYPGQIGRDWFNHIFKTNRPFNDTAAYDMQVDRAIEIADMCETIPSVYYFSVPCSYTYKDKDGKSVPFPDMVPFFLPTAEAIGKFSGVTAGGVVLDEKWQENDGLVNTISERAPFHAPQKDIDPAHIEPGIWNVFPTIHWDHMFFNGGFLKTSDARTYFVDYIERINTLG